jgi:KaiC/GvpD/RAD55 family RecA-like ATPase
MSLSDLIAQTDEEIEWVWDLYLPKGRLTLLVAFMKVGKSTFAYALAIAIAQGRPFLGHSTRQGPVLILALEEHVQDVKTRLVLFGANERKDPIQVHVAALAPSPENFAAVREHVMEHGTEIIIVDTLASLWNIPDENNNAEVHRRVRPWLDLAHESGCTVLLIHHERKSGGEGGRGIRGGSALFALMDQALILERRDGGAPTHRSLTAFGRYRDTPKELILELDGTTYRRIGTPTELSLESAKDKVFDALSDNPQRIQVVIESSKLKKKLVQDALDALLEEDKIIREGVGVKGKPFTYRVAE